MIELLNKETFSLLKRLVKAIEELNEHLSDFKTMVASWLGYKVKKED